MEGTVQDSDARARSWPGAATEGSPNVNSATAAQAYLRRTSDGASASAFPDGLYGSFNVAVWDGKLNTLTLANDKAGSKQLYYFHDETTGLFLFGSELKCLLAHPSVPPEIDRQGLALYLRLGCTLPPFTIFRGAKKLASATKVMVDSRGRLSKGSYWRPRTHEKGPDHLEYWSGRIQTEVTNAVGRLAGGSRLGVYLSGGVESTALLAALRQAQPAPPTFSLIYAGSENQDREWARRAAREAGAQHHEVVVNPSDLTPEVMSNIGRLCDEPADTLSLGPTNFFLARAAAMAGIDCCLNGMVGENLFGSRVLPAGFELNESSLVDLLEQRQNHPGLTLRQRRRLLAGSDVLDNGLLDVLKLYREQVTSEEPLRVVNRVLFLRSGPGRTLAHLDAISQKNRVDVGVPFLDMRLFEVSEEIPWRLRGNDDERLERATLRAAFGDVTPSLLEERDKVGLSGVPWRRPMFAKLERLARREVESLAGRGILEPRYIRKLVASTRHKDTKALWLLFALSVWHSFHIERSDPFADLPDDW